MAPSISYKEPSIGRVVTSPLYRKQGVGIILMQKSIDALLEKYNSKSCRISAQTYLIKFYNQFDFEVCSEEYLEDNLPHVEMLKWLVFQFCTTQI